MKGFHTMLACRWQFCDTARVLLMNKYAGYQQIPVHGERKCIFLKRCEVRNNAKSRSTDWWPGQVVTVLQLRQTPVRPQSRLKKWMDRHNFPQFSGWKNPFMVCFNKFPKALCHIRFPDLHMLPWISSMWIEQCKPNALHGWLHRLLNGNCTHVMLSRFVTTHFHIQLLAPQLGNETRNKKRVKIKIFNNFWGPNLGFHN